MSVSASDWVKGVTLSVLASMFGGASKLAIRKSFLMEEALKSEVEQWQYANQTRRTAFWLRISAMFGMTVLNPLCGVLAMKFSSPSIVAPFSGLTLVWIVIFSDTLIGERPSFMQLVAASLIVLGEIVLAFFGDHTNDEGTTLEDLELSYSEPTLILYLVGITLWLLWYWTSHTTSTSLRRFAWGVSGGSITGIQNFLKDGLTILKAKESLLWYTPVFFMLALAAAFGGLLLLTACMKRHGVMYSSAMFVGAFVLSASIRSAAHYHIFVNLEKPINYALYPLGLIILMAGVWMMANESKEESDKGPIKEVDIGDRFGSSETNYVLRGASISSYGCAYSVEKVVPIVRL